MEEVTSDLVIKDAFVFIVMESSAIYAEGAISVKAQRQGCISIYQVRGKDSLAGAAAVL